MTTFGTHAHPTPKGRGRSREAMCYWLGPHMEAEINTRIKASAANFNLKASQHLMRDGSKPVLEAIEANEESREPRVEKRSFSHFNEPRSGDGLEEEFKVVYINATVCDNEVELVFRDVTGHDTVVLNEANLDGNVLNRQVKRPDGLLKGNYRKLDLHSCARFLIY